MKIGIIGEGFTEYEAVPHLVGKFGHTIVGRAHLHGVGTEYPWEPLIKDRVYALVRSYAVKSPPNRPDKVIVVIDREDRPECCGRLAEIGLAIIQDSLAKEALFIPVSIIIPNKILECWLFAQPGLLDRSKLFRRPISCAIGNQTDGKNILDIVKNNLAPKMKWKKVEHGKALAQKIDLMDQAVLNRSRSLRKFVKEVR